MQVINNALANKLKKLLALQEDIDLLEDKYTLLLKADEPLEVLKETQLKIKYLKVELNAKEEHALTLFK